MFVGKARGLPSNEAPVIVLNVIMLNAVMLSVVMLNVIMLNVVMLSFVILNVVMLSVVAPKRMPSLSSFILCVCSEQVKKKIKMMASLTHIFASHFTPFE
jgi:hypothetical protein